MSGRGREGGRACAPRTKDRRIADRHHESAATASPTRFTTEKGGDIITRRDGIAVEEEKEDIIIASAGGPPIKYVLREDSFVVTGRHILWDS